MRYGAKKVASSSNVLRKNEEHGAGLPSDIHRPGSKAQRVSTISPGRGSALVILCCRHQFLEYWRLLTLIQVWKAWHPGEELIFFCHYKRLFLTKGHAAVQKYAKKNKKLWTSYDLSLCHWSLSSICSWDADVQPRYLSPRSLLPLGCGGLVGHAGVALIRGSLSHFHLGAELLLVHQHLCWQAPAAQAGLRRDGRHAWESRRKRRWNTFHSLLLESRRLSAYVCYIIVSESRTTKTAQTCFV